MAIDKIQSESINLADTFAFTGTVTGAGGVNTPAFQVKLGNEPAVSTSTWTKVPCSVETYDVGGCYDNSTNFRFTPTTAGKYVFYVQVGFNALADGDYMFAAVRKNGSTIFGDGTAINHTGLSSGLSSRYTISAEANGSSDYFQVKVYIDVSSGTGPAIYGNTLTSQNVTFAGYRIGT